ncbi:outer membrane protein [Erythrobacter sp. YT30]|uniref:outer membrane protein n=1 Tax=Erythrobacter sp. YT30 TaxID=1735012 RepID=UPI0009EC292C|nr:outer membrane beta-barrel protein [Erythrobacter sp. YT30]
MSIRTIALGAVAMSALAIPSIAQAQDDDGGIYVGVSGGVALPSDSNNSGEFDATVPATPDFGEIPAGTELAWETENDTGFAISGQIGYDFGNGFRAELEGTYNEYNVDTHTGLTVGGANIDAVDVAVLTRGTPDAANPTVGAVIADGQGDVSNLGIFANVFYDIQTGSGFKPYVGAGVGYQSTDVEYSPSGVLVGDDSDGSFAYQAMAGASFELSEQAEIFGQYTYRSNFSDADIELDLLPATLGVESAQSIISAGVRFKL